MSREKRGISFDKKRVGLCTSWAIFPQIHPVTLTKTLKPVFSCLSEKANNKFDDVVKP
jgi:hypothetical protein